MKVSATLHIVRDVELELPENLALVYKRFQKKYAPGDWSLIKNFVQDEAEQYMLRGQELCEIEINDIE